jgi:hypothetical protein
LTFKSFIKANLNYLFKCDIKERIQNEFIIFLIFIFYQSKISFIDRGFIFKKLSFFIRESNKAVSKLANRLHMKPALNTDEKTAVYAGLITLHSLQIDFSRILSSHEHFVPLNLPIFPDLSELLTIIQTKATNKAKPFTQLGQVDYPSLSTLFSSSLPKLAIESRDYFTRHYLVGTMLRQLFRSLHSPSQQVQAKAVAMLRNVLESHDLDPR